MKRRRRGCGNDRGILAGDKTHLGGILGHFRIYKEEESETGYANRGGLVRLSGKKKLRDGSRENPKKASLTKQDIQYLQ